jgi:hypothetical protein
MFPVEPRALEMSIRDRTREDEKEISRYYDKRQVYHRDVDLAMTTLKQSLNHERQVNRNDKITEGE